MKLFMQWLRRGNVFIWFSGTMLSICLLMIVGLVGFIAAKGLVVFWPQALVQVHGPEGEVLGEITSYEAPFGTEPAKVQFRVGNRDIYGQDFKWFKAAEISRRQEPKDALLIERLENGAFFGSIRDITQDGQPIAIAGAAVEEVKRRLPAMNKLQAQIRKIEKGAVGDLNRKLEDCRRTMESESSAKARAALEQKEQSLKSQYDQLQTELDQLRVKVKTISVTLLTVDGKTKEIPLGGIVRIEPANDLNWFGKVRLYFSRLWEFVADDPRESNTEGGIFPAIFGTVMMVLIMSMLVVPLGVVTALFLREYAKDGLLVRAVRVAVNNLAGVPSIVFGVFGLGFFVYAVGGTLDQLFYSSKLPTPTFGTGGIIWASLTLALLTVPVVVVATEEALAAVPRNQREASLALGATKWQTIWNVVLPGAAPGILTGLILAMSRGAGEVAPLMLTGVVKLAPAMPLDGSFPFLHLDRKFMHLGFHIYDVGFQSPNSEAAKPMVFMTALLLLFVVVMLNLVALRLRRKLRARLGGSTF